MSVIGAAYSVAAVASLTNLDLNLLVALDALLQQRGVSRAARQLGLSQPSLSGSLARLRRHFDDDLLSRVGNEYRLTPLALRLKPRVRAALDGIERIFYVEPDFDPRQSTREFTIWISDYGTAVLGRPLARLLAASAPRARLRLAHNNPEVVDRVEQTLLSSDLMVLPHGSYVAGLRHAELFRDEWVILAAAENRAVHEGLTRADLAAMPWVMTYDGPTASTPAARQLRILGIEPRTQLVTETFRSIPDLIVDSDRIALVQRRLAATFDREAGVRAVSVGLDLDPLVAAMWWHPINDDDPEHRFLRGLVLEAAAGLGTSAQGLGDPRPQL